MVKTNNLSEKSDLYYDMNQTYERFSQVEDTPGKIDMIFKNIANGRILDLGCGTGKYTKLLSRKGTDYIGLDLSQDQINIAKTKSETGKFICSSAENIPLKDNSIDFGVACWVIGTIPENDRKLKVINEIKRVLRKGGKFYLIENDEGGEFEEIRNRTQDTRTRDYNKWLIDNGFKTYKKFKTHFEFDNIKEAKKIFGKIWGEKIKKNIKSKFIKQKIIIFKYEKTDK